METGVLLMQLCHHRVLDGHWAAQRLSDRHVHVSAISTAETSREAALRTGFHGECISGNSILVFLWSEGGQHFIKG